MSARYPVRWSSQSANDLIKGDLLLGLGPEPLELHLDLRVGVVGDAHLERIHRARGDRVGRLATEVEAAGVARAEEALAVGPQVHRAAQVRALGREGEYLLALAAG